MCGNRLTLPIDRVDRAVLETMAGKVLNPPIVDAVIAGVLESLEPATRAKEAQGYRTELTRVEGELARLTEAIATGGADRVTARGGEGATGEAR